MASWTRKASEILHRFSVFSVRSTEWLRDGVHIGRAIHTFETPDWCNVVPITRDGNVVFVEQHRFGIESLSLEIPGGLIDEGEEPIHAARRELREESGYECEEIVPLGAVHANPALQGTRLHMFLATGCTPHAKGQALDGIEDCAVRLVPLGELDRTLREGKISHALVWTALLAYRLRTQ
jgi:8-oxo-dGTP pyrophosphatase MutT (NUDIX family)